MLDLLSRLTEYPGNYVYYLVVVLSIGITLILSYRKWRKEQSDQYRRAIQGLAILLLGLFFLMIFSGLIGSESTNAVISMPVLDRALILYSIIWITWLWSFPEPSRSADRAGLLLSILIALISVTHVMIRASQYDGAAFNNSTNDLIWQAASLFAILIGGFVLVIRRPDHFTFGLCMLGLGFIGHTAHLIIKPDGNYSGVVRLFYLASFTILPTLAFRNRMTIEEASGFLSITQEPSEKEARPPKRKTKPSALTPDGKLLLTERRRYSTDPKTFNSMLSLAAETDANKIGLGITRAVAQAMLSDLCFLVFLTDNKHQLSITAGYDLIREEQLEGGSLNNNAIPMLANAIQRGRPIRLPSSSTSADVKGLGDLLGINSVGHLMSVPMMAANQEVLGAILLLSPYSDRIWTAEDQVYLTNISHALVPLLHNKPKEGTLTEQVDVLRELETRNAELREQIEKLEREVRQSEANTAEFLSLVGAREESQRTIDQLRKEILEIKSKGIEGAKSDAQLEHELNSALTEIATLKNQLLVSDRSSTDSLPDATGGKTREQSEVIASLSQELRQPMSSVIGYTDLLLGESVGILGALQRKFVERIKTSIERISKLIDDMIQVTTLDVEMTDLKSEPVDLNEIIDNAMSYTSGQVREKNISLHLDLPKKVAPIHADQEALQQILIHLLQNAGSASPMEGSITLTVRTQVEQGRDFVLIQVSDTGGGIPSDEIPRVFTRLFRADNVLIQGVGDTGVGLSIAKSLTEAQNGRIWVESQMGQGSTFSVLLPISERKEKKPAKSRAKP